MVYVLCCDLKEVKVLETVLPFYSGDVGSPKAPYQPYNASRDCGVKVSFSSTNCKSRKNVTSWMKSIYEDLEFCPGGETRTKSRNEV